MTLHYKSRRGQQARCSAAIPCAPSLGRRGLALSSFSRCPERRCCPSHEDLSGKRQSLADEKWVCRDVYQKQTFQNAHFFPRGSAERCFSSHFLFLSGSCPCLHTLFLSSSLKLPSSLLQSSPSGSLCQSGPWRHRTCLHVCTCPHPSHRGRVLRSGLAVSGTMSSNSAGGRGF